ncbi:MAG: hypothetical protein HY929_05800 [Euryarchaeota archaeon]|nr:hypothetical protein [Euryarchaeota archaeon]
MSNTNAIEHTLNELKLKPDIIYIGLFGSLSREAIRTSDIDVLVIKKTKPPKNIEFKENLEIHYMTPKELYDLPVTFRFSLAKDLRDIYGRHLAEKLRVEAEIGKVIEELAKGIHSYMRITNVAEGEHKYIAAFEASKRAAWLILLLHSERVTNSPLEIRRTLEMLTERKYIPEEMFRTGANSLAFLAKDYIELHNMMNTISPEKLAQHYEYSLRLAKEVFKLLTKDFNSIRKSFGFSAKLVKDASSSGDPDSIRVACQGLFLVVYDIVGLYLSSKSSLYSPYHKERKEELVKLAEFDSNAMKILREYEDALDELHMLCHYEGRGNVQLLESWVNRVREFLEYNETIL